MHLRPAMLCMSMLFQLIHSKTYTQMLPVSSIQQSEMARRSQTHRQRCTDSNFSYRHSNFVETGSGSQLS